MERQPHHPGSRLGRYRIHALESSYGAEQIYRAETIDAHGDEASSVLLRVFESSTSHAAQDTPFARAGALLSRLKHPSLIPILEHGEEDGQRYVAMPFLTVRSMNRAMLDPANHDPLRRVEIADAVCRAIGSALGYLHKHGVVHGAVDARNIVQTRDGRFMLTGIGDAYDFGADDDADALALIQTMRRAESDTASKTHVDSRDDLFGLGAVLYELVTGVAPPPGDVNNSLCPPPLAPHAALPSRLRDVIQTLLQPNPDSRFLSAGDMLFALGKAREHGPVPALPPTRPARKSRHVGTASEAVSEVSQEYRTHKPRASIPRMRLLVITAALIVASSAALALSTRSTFPGHAGAVVKTGADTSPKPAASMRTPTQAPSVGDAQIASPKTIVATAALPATATRHVTEATTPTPAPSASAVTVTTRPQPSVTVARPTATPAPTQAPRPTRRATRVPSTTPANAATETQATPTTATSTEAPGSSPALPVDSPTATAPSIDFFPDQPISQEP
jgi:serine/threonine-protein kinase